MKENKGKNWTNKKNGNKDYSRSGNGRRTGKGQHGNKGRNNNSRSGGNERQFQKFADTAHNNNNANSSNNNSNYWPERDWPNAGDGIYPWVRNTTPKPLPIAPKHINFQLDTYQEQASTNNDFIKQQKDDQLTKNPFATRESDKQMSVPINKDNSVTASSAFNQPAEAIKLPVQTDLIVKIKTENDPLKKIKQETKSSSSSSSSSESSNEEETQLKIEPVNAKSSAPQSSKPSQLSNIKLKSKVDAIPSTPVKTIQKGKPESSSSTSSSSSDEESEPNASESIAKIKLQYTGKNSKSGSSPIKKVSEDEVVCIGNLENQIILEDESDGTEIEDEVIVNNEQPTKKNSSKKSAKKCAEMCMLCGKKGHNSFQCQMICKNCSAPYHGYRTCPNPANLNTMLQLFLEFCMQQFQHFNAQQQCSKDSCDNVPKPQIEHSHLNINKKLNKAKRKQVKSIESNAKSNTTKKRKISASKKISKNDSDESSDDDSDGDNTDSETSSPETDDTSESLVSSKKKRKMKKKNTSKKAPTLSSFSTNPVNLPMVLNSFPNLAVPNSVVQNPSTSANALNTLLLTQMFQNALGSLKQ